ncbi:MAG: alpha-galactosidase [Alistipes sp.]|nr:alpha-galactosidase [Alistipes senegalensis]MCM1249625.1 alpha-galactosidase [Alistipes sp.]
MKLRYLSSLLLLAAAAVSCHDGKTLVHGDLRIEIDERMHWRIASLAEETPLCGEFMPQGILTTDEMRIADFRLLRARRIGKGYDLTGLYEENGIRVEKHLRLMTDAEFPDMALVETYYVNRGRPLTIRSATQNTFTVETDSLIWSFQPTSTSARQDWILPVRPGFEQQNYLGMNDSDYGGGIPMITLWRPDCGISTGLREPTLQMISMPVGWAEEAAAPTAGLRRDFKEGPILEEGDTLRLDRSFVSVHKGDFYAPLRQFTRYMQRYEGFRLADSEPEAFEPVWCAWGYERMFTLDEVIGTLPKVAELGFRWVDVDDGFQIAEGDWEPNSRFPGGDRDMRRLTDAIHARGLKAKLWWAPLAADPGTRILREHPEMQLITEEGGPEFISWWDSYYLSPVNPATERYTVDLVDRFIDRWNFDGLKLDGQHLNCCMPDHNPHSGLACPDVAVERFPTFFKAIFDRARTLKPDAVVQLCPCGCAMNFFNLPYMNQAVASDPTSSWQIRLKGKAYKAINQRMAYYADHVELSDGGLDFPTQIGIGGVVGSKFTWPRNNPHVKEDYRLTPAKEALYKKWVALYNEKMLPKGDYLNLYDIAWDKPETHVIRKDGSMYYAFYADEWKGGEIALRGLDPNLAYTITEYAADGRTYVVEGSRPVIAPAFEGSYLIEATPRPTTTTNNH